MNKRGRRVDRPATRVTHARQHALQPDCENGTEELCKTLCSRLRSGFFMALRSAVVRARLV
jgi:hypothetical protein